MGVAFVCSLLNMNCCWYSWRNWVDRCSSRNSEYTLLISSTLTSVPFLLRHVRLAAVMSCMAYLSDVSMPMRVNMATASSLISTSSSSHLNKIHNSHIIIMFKTLKIWWGIKFGIFFGGLPSQPPLVLILCDFLVKIVTLRYTRVQLGGGGQAVSKCLT